MKRNYVLFATVLTLIIFSTSSLTAQDQENLFPSPEFYEPKYWDATENYEVLRIEVPQNTDQISFRLNGLHMTYDQFLQMGIRNDEIRKIKIKEKPLSHRFTYYGPSGYGNDGMIGYSPQLEVFVKTYHRMIVNNQPVVKKSDLKKLESLPNSSILRVERLIPAESVKRYGNITNNGAIVVTTQDK